MNIFEEKEIEQTNKYGNGNGNGNGNEFYKVIQWDKTLKFENIIELENYLVSLDKSFVYNNFNELVAHVIANYFVIDITTCE